MASFPTATDLRAKKLINSKLAQEICDIQVKIITANEACNLDVTICDTELTSGVNAEDYYNAWKGCNTNRFYEAEMNTIITHFTDLGYTITRVTNDATQNTFCWQISW